MSLPSRVLFSSSSRALAARSFHTSARRMADSAPLPARKPMGAFRGGLFGFLLGSFLSGSAAYSYLLKEYKTANDLLTEDIYVRNQRDEAIDKQRPLDSIPSDFAIRKLTPPSQTLQASVTRLSNYVQALETKTQGKK